MDTSPAHLAELTKPRTDTLSATAAHARGKELHSFFVQTYHLKDAVITETTLPASEVEDAISGSPELGLLADLANLDKHSNLTRPPRTGAVPRIEDPSGVADGRTPGWRLNLPIHHGSARLDGLEVAYRAMQAWENALRGWALI